MFSAPGLPLDCVKDPTGAGDVFAGGFMGFISSTGVYDEPTFRRAIIYGSAMASFCVQDFGVKALLNLELPRIEERYNHFVELAKF